MRLKAGGRAFFILGVLFGFFTFGFSEINHSLYFQGFLAISSTSLPLDGTADLKFSLYDARSGGTLVFSENRCDVQVSAGKYFVEIGSATTGGIPDSVFRDNTEVWLQVEADSDNDCSGAYEILSPRIRMSASPYSFNSLYASTASAATSVFRADVIGAHENTTYGAVTISTNLFVAGGIYVGLISPGQKLSVAGLVESTTGGFVFPDGSVQVKADAETKWELNSIHMYSVNQGYIGMGTGPNPLAKLHVSSGSGETGDIFLVSTGTSKLFRVTGEGKAYANYFYGDGSNLVNVFGTDVTRVLRSGDTMSGNLTMSGSSITVIGNNPSISRSIEITTDSAKGVYHFVVSTTGYVGVGTGSPSFALHVKKDGWQDVLIAVSSGAGNSVEIKGNGDIVAARYFGDGSNLQNVSTVDNTKVLRTGDTMSGALTISGSSLTVQGEAFFSGFTRVLSSAIFSGDVFVSSDIVSGGGGHYSGPLTASSGTFTLSGATQYSIETSSGIKVNSGIVSAPYFSGDGTLLTNLITTDTTKILRSGDTMTGNLTISGSSLTVIDSVSGFYAFTVSTGIGNYSLAITTLGLMGVGMSNPAVYLDVKGNLSISNPPGGFSNLILQSNSGHSYFYFRDDSLPVNQDRGVLGFNTPASQQGYDLMYKAGAPKPGMWDSREAFRVKSNKYGNWQMVIGKDSPLSKLDIGVNMSVSTQGAGNAPILYVDTTSLKVSVNMSTQSLSHTLNVGGDIVASSSITAMGGYYGDVYGDIKTSSITLTGNMGLGMNNQNAKLEIRENGDEVYTMIIGSNTSNLSLYENYDLVLTTTGRLGIGKDNPSAYLHTRGGMKIGNKNDTNNAYVHFISSAADVYMSWEEVSLAAKGALGFKYGEKGLIYKSGSASLGGGVEAIRISSNGYVGIGGVASPAYRLEVNGGMMITSSITANGGFYGDGSSLSGILVKPGGSMGGPLTVTSSVTIGGDAFSVGIDTFSVNCGMVAISTNSPVSVLDVRGDASFGQGSAKSTFTAEGFWRPRMLNTAQLQVLSPSKIGEVIANSDILDLCISTGTAQGDWALINSKGGLSCAP